MMPDRDSIKVMQPIDDLRPGFRALVHEYGAVIVLKMIAEGYDRPEDLRPVLETWRERRQEIVGTPAYLRINA
jgi:hypothetical protein